MKEIILLQDEYTTLKLKTRIDPKEIDQEERFCLIDESDMVRFERNRKNKKHETYYKDFIYGEDENELSDEEEAENYKKFLKEMGYL